MQFRWTACSLPVLAFAVAFAFAFGAAERVSAQAESP